MAGAVIPNANVIAKIDVICRFIEFSTLVVAKFLIDLNATHAATRAGLTLDSGDLHVGLVNIPGLPQLEFANCCGRNPRTSCPSNQLADEEANQKVEMRLPPLV